MEKLIKRCKHCGSFNASLYCENCYHDIQCPECGCKSGVRGDENEVLALWNGDVYQPTLYGVVWSGLHHGMLLEIHEEREDADKSVKKLNHMIRGGTSIYGNKLDLSLGTTELCSVQPIQLNKLYKVQENKNE